MVNMITDINLFRIYENFKDSENKLNEGLIKSYPIDKSFDILINKTDPVLDNVKRESMIQNNKIMLCCNKLNISEFLDLLTTINNLGYFISTIKPYQNTPFKFLQFNEFKIKFFNENSLNKFTSYDIIIEAKFDIIYKTSSNKLYHVTEDIYVNKIFKNGLIVKSYNTLLDYPERIYLTDDIQHSKLFIDKKKFYYNNYQDKNIERRIGKDQYRKKSDNVYVILEIDNSNKDIILYLDPNMSNAYFTLNTIPPNKIKKYEE